MEYIALGLNAEFMSIDFENQSFRILKDTDLKHKIDRSVFNWFYGYRMHSVISSSGVVQHSDITRSVPSFTTAIFLVSVATTFLEYTVWVNR